MARVAGGHGGRMKIIKIGVLAILLVLSFKLGGCFSDTKIKQELKTANRNGGISSSQLEQSKLENKCLESELATLNTDYLDMANKYYIQEYNIYELNWRINNLEEK